jgi:hypothetical protein
VPSLDGYVLVDVPVATYQQPEALAACAVAVRLRDQELEDKTVCDVPLLNEETPALQAFLS